MFRPQVFCGKFKLKNNPIGQYNWQVRSYNSNHVLRVGGYLHYLADHAPLPLQRKWKKAFSRFTKLHPKF